LKDKKAINMTKIKSFNLKKVKLLENLAKESFSRTTNQQPAVFNIQFSNIYPMP